MDRSSFRRYRVTRHLYRRPDNRAADWQAQQRWRERRHTLREPAARSDCGIRLPGAGLIFSSGNGRKWTEPSGKLLHDEVVPAQICRHRGVGLCGCEEAGNKGHEGRLAGRRTCAEHVAVRAPMADSQSHCRQGSLSARHRQRRSVRLVRSRGAGSGGSAAHPGPPRRRETTRVPATAPPP